MTVLGDPLWTEALSLANVVFALILARACFANASREKLRFMRVMLYVFGCLGLYWAGLYVFVIFTPAGTVDPVWFGQIFVRPAFTLSLALMASVAYARWKTHE